MPQHRKTDPIKYCEQCGVLLTRKRYNGVLENFSGFGRRKYCGQRCFGLAQVKENPTVSALHKRSTKLRKDKCEQCGTTRNLAAHHIDLDPSNNAPSNLMTLCGSCHTTWHWKHGRKSHKERAACSICGKPSKGYSLCQKHLIRFKKYGDPLLTMKWNGLRNALCRATD